MKNELKIQTKNRINLLIIEQNNFQDVNNLINYSKKTRFKLLRFEDVCMVRYNLTSRLLRYFVHLKRLNLKNIYSKVILFINAKKRNYVFDSTNVRKLKIQSLTFKQYNSIIDRNEIKGIIISMDVPWLNNLILFSKRLGLKIIIASKEHLYSNAYKMAEKMTSTIPARYDLMCCGGQDSANWWKLSKSYDKNKIKITGGSRFDTYYNEKLKSKEKFCKLLGINPKSKIIFFPSFKNISRLTVYDVNSRELKNIHNSSDLDFCWPIKEVIKVDYSKYKSDVLKVLYNIAKNNSDVNIIIKLHPDQQPNDTLCVDYELRAINRELPNFIGILGKPKEIDPRDIVINSDVLVGLFSTMLLEGLMLDRGVVIAKWGNADAKDCIPYEKYNSCPVVHNQMELNDLLLKVINSEMDFNKFKKGKEKLILRYLYKQDGQACKRIFQELDALF